jgi:hypothetical protein
MLDESLSPSRHVANVWDFSPRLIFSVDFFSAAAAAAADASLF